MQCEIYYLSKLFKRSRAQQKPFLSFRLHFISGWPCRDPLMQLPENDKLMIRVGIRYAILLSPLFPSPQIVENVKTENLFDLINVCLFVQSTKQALGAVFYQRLAIQQITYSPWICHPTVQRITGLCEESPCYVSQMTRIYITSQ